MNKYDRDTYINVIVFILLFFFSFIVQMAIDNTVCQYDAATYWSLGKAYNWSSLNLPWGFRGYLFPFLLSLCYKLGKVLNNEWIGFRLLSSLMFAFLFTYVFQKIAIILGLDVKKVYLKISGGICGVITFLFFRGLFVYPLSDVYAFAFSLISLIILYKVMKYQSIFTGIVYSFALGVTLYGAYNIRTIYLFFMIIVLLVLFVYKVIHLEWLSSIITSVSTFAGILFCAVPQIRQNYKLQNVFSLKVPTEGLMLWQLGTGVSTARYATYVGDKSAYKYAGMYFIDRIGKEILAREGIIEFTSYEEFIRVVLKYPLDFLGIYGRHFVNMLYPVFPNQYIKDIQNEKGIYLVLFYTVFFISCFYLLKMIGERKLRLGWLGILIFPCLCILPGAVEIRFFIALHFVIYLSLIHI